MEPEKKRNWWEYLLGAYAAKKGIDYEIEEEVKERLSEILEVVAEKVDEEVERRVQERLEEIGYNQFLSTPQGQAYLRRKEAKKAKMQILIEQEQQLAKKAKKANAEQKVLGKNFGRQSAPEKFKKFVDKEIECLRINIKRAEILQKIGKDTSEGINTIWAAVRSIYTMLLSSTIGSLSMTLNSPSNEFIIPKSELAIFNKLFKKWNQRVERGAISKEDYYSFVEEIKTYNKKGKIKDITKILKQLEDKIGLNQILKKLRDVEIGISKIRQHM